MDRFCKKACEEIDAGFFSGDAFHDYGSLKEIEFYMKRWEKEIIFIKEMMAENPEIFPTTA